MEEERLQKDLEAIEAEKKAFENGENVDSEEYEDSDDSDEEEMEEIDVETEEMEFSLTESEIDEWINELTRLKEDKEFILLEVDEENTLKINYQEESEEDSEDEELNSEKKIE